MEEHWRKSPSAAYLEALMGCINSREVVCLAKEALEIQRVIKRGDRRCIPVEVASLLSIELLMDEVSQLQIFNLTPLISLQVRRRQACAPHNTIREAVCCTKKLTKIWVGEELDKPLKPSQALEGVLCLMPAQKVRYMQLVGANFSLLRDCAPQHRVALTR